jgi:hypothetical protein
MWPAHKIRSLFPSLAQYRLMIKCLTRQIARISRFLVWVSEITIRVTESVGFERERVGFIEDIGFNGTAKQCYVKIEEAVVVPSISF